MPQFLNQQKRYSKLYQNQCRFGLQQNYNKTSIDS